MEREKIIVVRPEKLERVLNNRRIPERFRPGMIFLARDICYWDGFSIIRNPYGDFEIKLDGKGFIYK